MYKQKKGKIEQEENFLTETIAYLANTSEEFQKLYLYKFLKIGKDNKYGKIIFKTQIYTQDEKTKKISIPDLIIEDLTNDKIIAVCEHKIDADLTTDINNKSQLDNYYSKYKLKTNNFYLIKKENNSISTKKNWKSLNWEDLYLRLLEIIEINNYTYKDEDFFEYFFENKDITEFEKQLFMLIKLFDEFGLYDFSVNRIKKIGSPSNLINNAIKAGNFYSNIVKNLRIFAGANKNSGSKIQAFIDDGRIDINYKKDSIFSDIGIYFDCEDKIFNLNYNFQKYCKDTKSFSNLENNEKDKILKILEYESDEVFLKEFEKHQKNLEIFDNFFRKIFLNSNNSFKSNDLKLSKEYDDNNDKDEIYFIGKLKKKEIYFEFNKDNIYLSFSKKDFSSKLKNIVEPNDKKFRSIEMEIPKSFSKEYLNLFKKDFKKAIESLEEK